MNRREFLKTAGAGALGMAFSGCSEKVLNLLGPDREHLWGMNVHPYGGSLAGLQIQALADMGIQRARITLGLGRDLAGPYLAGYPAEWIGIIGDFDLGGVRPSPWPRLVRSTVRRSGGVSFYEVLNEPDLFLKVSAATYVRDYLRPAYDIAKELRPGVPVVAAAPMGTSRGRIYYYQMSDAGADDYCDYRAVHLYDQSSELFLAGTDRPILITETGTKNRSRHVDWWSDTMSRFGKVLETKRIYFYVLLDRPDSGYSVIAAAPDGRGNVQPVSPLYDYLRTK